MKEATFICTCCHEEYPMSQYQEASGDPLCPSCLEETVICSSCGARIWKDDNAGDDDTPLCQRCYDRYYTICDHCGAVIPYADFWTGNGLCAVLPGGQQLMDYGLPTSVTIDGQDFPVRYDFRVIMDIFEAINDPDMDNQERVPISELDHIIADRVSITSLLKTL